MLVDKSLLIKDSSATTTGVYFFHTSEEFGKTTNLTMLYAEVDDAIGQIHRRRCYLGMPERVVLVGMAFFMKVPRVCMELMENGPDGV